MGRNNPMSGRHWADQLQHLSGKYLPITDRFYLVDGGWHHAARYAAGIGRRCCGGLLRAGRRFIGGDMTGDESIAFAAVIMIGTFIVFYLFFRGDL